MHLLGILRKIINGNHSKGRTKIHINTLFIAKKDDSEDRRELYLEEKHISNLIKITDEEASTIERIINNCPCRRFMVFIPPTKQYFALINNQKQVKDYLWMISDLFFYPPQKRYYIIKDKKDKEWMKKFFEKYDSQ